MIEQAGIRSIVINMEHVAFDQGLARILAEKLEACQERIKLSCHTLEDLRADTLYHTVLDVLE